MKEMSQQNLPFWAKNTTLAVQIYFEIYTLVKRFCSNFPALSSKKLFFTLSHLQLKSLQGKCNCKFRKM